MKNNKNKSLFWYGFFAKIKKIVGSIFIFFGISMGLVSMMMNNTLWVFGLTLIVVGIVFLAKGSSQRFDYQRQSGYIVHSGD
ncbi:unnamed protein product [marine sediment metagenome]|uniref:Uncharacterized protein n=1 Tax=marine sediment metagenome TaxID=412755 RepID=X1KS61_9ZZZZ